MMEDRLRDLLQCEEQLRNTLHANDKEKLRQKLEFLQKEHSRTFRRLRRAERLDLVRKHSSNRSSQHNSHDHTKADGALCSSAMGQNGTNHDLVQNQIYSPGVANYIADRKSQMTGSSLCSDMACTPTSDSSQDSVQISKASPALRLRSRRSRIRWAERSAHSNQSSANSQEGPKATAAEQKDTQPLPFNNTSALHESEELFSPTENESSSLLLPHWNLRSQEEKEQTEKQPLTLEYGLDPEGRQENSASLPFKTQTSSPHTDNKLNVSLDNVCEKRNNHIIDTTTTDSQPEEEKVHHKIDGEIKMEKSEQDDDDGQRLLDSCTLVEGLLFPAEYYVRTTRRMTVSQSQPDMNAVILSHLNTGRLRRGRGRRRPMNRTVSVDRAVMEASETNSQTSCEISTKISCSLDRGVSSVVVSPSRGRRGRRGRGRGRGRTSRHTVGPKEKMIGNTQNALAQGISSALSPPEFMCEGAVRQNVQLEDSRSAASQVTTGEQGQALNGNNKPPLILQKNQRYGKALHKNPEDWPSLLLPSSSQNSAGTPLSPLPPISLLKILLGSHIQDFHLPDDQFASLKLLKLRQVMVTAEQYTPCNSSALNHGTFSPQLPPLSFSPTPEMRQTCTKQHALVTQKDDVNATFSQSRKAEHPSDKVDVAIQEKTELVCPSPEILHVMPTQGGEIRTNLSGDLIESKILHNPKKNFSSNTQSIAVDKEIDVRDEASENMGLNDDGVRSCELAMSRDTGCLLVNGVVEKENLCLESQASSKDTILPKNSSVPKSCSKNFSGAHLENVPNVKEHCHQRCEKIYQNPPTQLLLSPSLESATCSVALPHLGFTPQMSPLKTPRSPPALTPPSSVRPISEALSPPVLSPCPASPLRSQPPGLQLSPPSHRSRGQCEEGKEPSEKGVDAVIQGYRDETKICSDILKTPAGGRLVDVCCVSSSSGSMWVAAAGKWAVCLWRNQGHPTDWCLLHTWSFEEPVICVFAVPDAPDLLCATLGQLEIRQVRVLSCSSLSQAVLCDCVVQTAMGAPCSRVVCLSHTSTTSILRIFTLTDHISAPHCLTLVSPGGPLSSLASVEGLPDALLGTDEAGSFLIWNMKTGHLLQKVSLGGSLSHSSCLRAYSHSGVLFALMQHHSLGTLKRSSDSTEQEESGEALFSLLAINPRNRRWATATQFYPPKNWTGRLCEADALGRGLVGLSQRGSACVWDLEHPQDPPWTVGAPEGDGWQLARWGGPRILLTALHTGDVMLHSYGDTPERVSLQISD